MGNQRDGVGGGVRRDGEGVGGGISQGSVGVGEGIAQNGTGAHKCRPLRATETVIDDKTGT